MCVCLHTCTNIFAMVCVCLRTACQEAYNRLLEQEACSTGCVSQPAEPEIKRKKVKKTPCAPVHMHTHANTDTCKKCNQKATCAYTYTLSLRHTHIEATPTPNSFIFMPYSVTHSNHTGSLSHPEHTNEVKSLSVWDAFKCCRFTA